MLWYRAPLVLFIMCSPTALAGPPYVTDDAEPTDYKRFEIYMFGGGTAVRGDNSGEAGIDFNYGVAPDTQLTVVVPFAYDRQSGTPTATGLGNVELAIKYRFLHQDRSGWDVSFFPRVFLPSASHAVGESHALLLLPIWVQKDWGDWSTFGGGGCAINHGGLSRDFCLAGWAVVRQILPKLQLGAELYYRTADSQVAHASAGIGVGARYDVDDHYHWMASFGPGIENAAEANRYTWYAALLVTF
jgi:hypothetical protein